jgi:uncharacterized damage-inducible protein DinB
MKPYFIHLFTYNAWANRRVLNALKEQDVRDAKMLSLMGHIVAALMLWLHRVQGLPPPQVKLWDDWNVDQLIELSELYCTRWQDFVNKEDSFSRELSYTNYTGDPYINNVEMIMIHQVNHATYHRAQVAMLMRQQGYQPVNTDFITWDRVRTGQLKD